MVGFRFVVEENEQCTTLPSWISRVRGRVLRGIQVLDPEIDITTYGVREGRAIKYFAQVPRSRTGCGVKQPTMDHCDRTSSGFRVGRRA